MGAHRHDSATTFRVWAPNASVVSVVSDRNGWRAGEHALEPDNSGVWRGTFDGYSIGDLYKFSVTSADGVHRVAKTDPFARASQIAPETASVIAAPTHEWGDSGWMADRAQRNRHDAAISTYEVHLGSWRYEPGGYEALARQLADYCVDMGFTHVELLPIMEHPFYGSWGYQTTGYFAPTARYGRPDDVMRLVDMLHLAGVGVILDWVPSHFPTDEAALGYFDGTHLYEHADPKQGFHPDWKSFVFNYGRPEVRSFLLSSAHFWLDEFHIDGLRVDAVASMLYLDYSREDGEWVPNIHGGNENLEAVAFLQDLNRTVSEAFPDVVMVAEESTAWPGVTNPTDDGGLGFGFKWDMGWMNDTLEYLSQDPIHRQHHHDRITFRSVYQASENYVLPLSHDEVVHGKGSLLAKMPGDRWQQFANLRLLLGYQWTTPGKKLLFMGGEFGSPTEWNHEAELPWAVLGEAEHAGVQGWVRRLNELYVELPALHEIDRDPAGFRWIVGDDREQSVVAFLRIPTADRDPVLVVMNNTPVARHGYRLGVPADGTWQLVANSDAPGYGGGGMATIATFAAGADGSHGFDSSIEVDLPPLALLIYVGTAARAG
jgi:1,4-alpha-glucan branching enzyme